MSPSEIALFKSFLEPKKLAKKDYLLKTGEVCRYDYFINKGCLKVFYIDHNGNECITKFAIEDWWLVDIDSFLNENKSVFNFQALEDTEFFQIDRCRYNLIHQQIPEFNHFTMQRWQVGFTALQKRFMQSVSLTAEEKYNEFKEKYPNLEQRVPLRLIASYLGITPEFLSVLRKKWVTAKS